jgi:PRC-barrel domain
MQVNDPAQVLDRTVVDCDGTTIGTVTELYLDEHAERPGWIAVRTGLFGTHVSLVPLAGAAESDDVVVVPYSKSHVKDAPHHDPEMALSREEEAELFAYYGFAYTEPPMTTAEPHPATSTADEPSSVEYTTEDAQRLEAVLRTDTGAGVTRLRRSVGGQGIDSPPTGSVQTGVQTGSVQTGSAGDPVGSDAESVAIPGRAAATGATAHGAVPAGEDQPMGSDTAIDVTEPATYPDDDLAADLRIEQGERERALRERQARGI